MAVLHTEYSTQIIDESRIPGWNKKLRDYINSNKDNFYDDFLEEESDWRIFEQLSELRTGIVSWYDFGREASILEIGAGFGALTGRLCRQCGHVTATERSLYRARTMAERYKDTGNLDIYAGDVGDIEFPEPFDYIVLIGLLESIGGGLAVPDVYIAYLKKLRTLLRPEGRLLLAVENRFGLRYFCGAVEPHTNRAFDGLNHYPYGTGRYSFSKKEIEDIVYKAGFARRKFYYPLPDYKLPQLIYTDEYLPEKNLKERLIPYYRRKDTLVADEQGLYDDVIENGVFPFFANSFLVECTCSGECGKAVYAAVSTDRGKERAYATVILADDSGNSGRTDRIGADRTGAGRTVSGRTVRKIPLYEEGKRNADQLFCNMEDLRKHQVPAVSHTKRPDGSLELPYIGLPTLSNYIKQIIKENTDEFLMLLDRIYGYILQASEEAADGKNALLEKQLKGLDDKEEGKKWEDCDFGPILKKAYMELIPLNCFYDEKKQEFFYFDQEFVRENYPAKYVLFRAIHYIYCFTPNAEQYYPKEKLIERFAMKDTWELYLKEEEGFLHEVRNHKKYRQFYQWAGIDRKRMLDNAKRLESEEEVVANYKIPDRMKKIWRAELSMLDEVERICKKYGLTYFLVHGSLLGAVRHKGFIPWDDDLDIAMPRRDYDKLIEAAARELPNPLSIHTPETEKDIFWGGFARIRNADTTGIEERELGHKGNLGIWIDILPLDVCTMDEKKLEKKRKRIRYCHRLIYAKIYGRDNPVYGDMKRWKWKGYGLLAHFYRHDRLCRMLDRAMRLYTEEDSEDVAFFTGYQVIRRLYAKDFKDTILLDFEGRKMPVPAGYKNYLFMTLGKDYMKYPPEEERKPKHTGIFDAERPYTDYVSRLTGMFDGAEGKKIILFGSGMMFEDYMKKWGRRYRPDFLVDNDENKWGRTRMGIEIRKPERVLEVPAEKRRLIICSYYYKEIQTQLEEMGISDYHIYVQKIEWILKEEAEKG